MRSGGGSLGLMRLLRKSGEGKPGRAGGGEEGNLDEV
jgi:hypothetical protein